MSTNCPKCGGDGILATNVLFDLYRCTKCHKEYWVEPKICSAPSCASWVDHDASGLCWYHAAQHGIHPEAPPKDPSLCHEPQCTRARVEGDLCDIHAWDAYHKPEDQ